jgi:hypothetical protein
LSRSVVFKESEMYYANCSSNVQQSVPDKVSLQVENLDEGESIFQDAAIPDPQVYDISPLLMILCLLSILLLMCSNHTSLL